MMRTMQQEEKTPDLELKGIGGFIGTEQYYNVMGVIVTDGVKYLMDNGYAWFVTDSIAVIICNKKIRAEPFLVVKLKVDLEKKEADLTIDGGNENILYRQHYDFTDARREEVKMYFENKVLCLPSER